MRKFVKSPIMAMANINKKRTGLNVNIWSDGQGCLRNKPDVVPRVKLISDDSVSISVSISANPEVLAPKDWQKRYKKSLVVAFNEGIEYVARNHDLLMKHYKDTDGSFDDYDLFNELKKRGEFR